jgi:hypothetical protein
MTKQQVEQKIRDIIMQDERVSSIEVVFKDKSTNHKLIKKLKNRVNFDYKKVNS